MATATQRRTDAADTQLAALLARQDELARAVGRRAAEVVRSWMLERDRTWVAVNFTKTRPEPPFDGDDALAAAVVALPRRVFRGGMDVRGSFIVRLADLNGCLGRLHDDQAQAVPRPRLEAVTVRDPDGGTAVSLFLDGAEFTDYEEYVVDAGRGQVYSDWIESRDDAVDSASPAVGALLRSSYGCPPGHRYIEGAPEGWPVADSEDR